MTLKIIMCSERWLEEREYQFDLAELQTKRSIAVTTSLTILTAAVALATVQLTMPASVIKLGTAGMSILLTIMSVIQMQKLKDEIKDERERIKQKYIKKYQTIDKDEDEED